MNSVLKIILRVFYSKLSGGNALHILATVFFSQKLLRINGRVPWPVHFTSRVLYFKRIQVGKRTFPGFSHGCYIQARNGIIIGSNLRMGPGVGLISANHDINDYDRWVKTNPIEIGDNVWIGMNSIVMPGIKIGENVVIGANSVVTSNIPSNSIAAGNPCKIIKQKQPYTGKDYSKVS